MAKDRELLVASSRILAVAIKFLPKKDNFLVSSIGVSVGPLILFWTKQMKEYIVENIFYYAVSKFKSRVFIVIYDSI